MAKIKWQEDSLLSVRVKEGLHTLALLKRSPYAWFFDIKADHGKWEKVDLLNLKPLFCVGIVNAVLSKMVEDVVDTRNIDASERNSLVSLAIPKLWIKPNQNTADWQVDNFVWRGGRLIELDPDIGTVDSPVVKPLLDLASDKPLIEACELTNMWSDQDLADRLVRFFDKGINRDDLKFEVFPGLWNDREALRPLTRRLPVPLR